MDELDSVEPNDEQRTFFGLPQEVRIEGCPNCSKGVHVAEMVSEGLPPEAGQQDFNQINNSNGTYEWECLGEIYQTVYTNSDIPTFLDKPRTFKKS